MLVGYRIPRFLGYFLGRAYRMLVDIGMKEWSIDPTRGDDSPHRYRLSDHRLGICIDVRRRYRIGVHGHTACVAKRTDRTDFLPIQTSRPVNRPDIEHLRNDIFSRFRYCHVRRSYSESAVNQDVFFHTPDGTCHTSSRPSHPIETSRHVPSQPVTISQPD